VKPIRRKTAANEQFGASGGVTRLTQSR